MKQKQDITTKPYYRCFICPRFRKECGGRPTRDMDLKEWCEYMRDIRDYFGLSNDYITEKAQSSSGTTERIMACNTSQDVMRATARRYEQAVIGPVGEFTCYLDHDSTSCTKMDSLEQENEMLKCRLEQIDEIHRKDIRVIKEEFQDQKKEYQEQIAFLKEQLKAWQSRSQ